MKKIGDFRDKDELIKRTDVLKKMVKETNQVLTAAIPLAESKWGGKKATKRMANDLQALFPQQLGITGWDGKERQVPYYTIYLDTQCLTPAICITLTDRDYGVDKELHKHISLFQKDGVIVPEKVIESINSAIHYNNKLIVEYDDAIKHFEKYQEQYRKAKETFMNALSKISPAFIESTIYTYTPKQTEWEKKIEEKLNK